MHCETCKNPDKSVKTHNFSTMRILFFFILSFAVISCNSTKETDIIQEGAVVENLADDFKFTEGPAADSHGNVYFTDQPNDRIMKWSIDDELSTWMQPSGRSNGLCFDRDDNLWSCADEKNELWIINKEKQVEVLLDSYENGKLNGPNDLWITPDGNAYFSDPFYKRPWWDRDTTQQDVQGVYYLDKEKNKVSRVVDDLNQPNGIIGTPNGRKLYVTDIGDEKTYVYSIESNGSLSGKKLFCNMGSD